MHRRLLTLGLTILIAPLTISAADQWPQFRGLQAGVAADDSALPDTWSETQNVAWKIDVPGTGLEFASRVGRSRLSHHRDQQRTGAGTSQRNRRSLR